MILRLIWPESATDLYAKWVDRRYSFWTAVCKTVRPMLSDRCLSACPVLSVCNVGALWPNGWTEQDETWHADRPRPWPHCVRRGPRSSSPKRGQSPQFLAHVYCGQTAAWIKMPLGMEVGLSPGHIVLDGSQLPLPKQGGTAPSYFSTHVCWGQTGGWIQMVRR